MTKLLLPSVKIADETRNQDNFCLEKVMAEVLQMSLFPSVNENRPKGWFKEATATLRIQEESGWPDAFGDALHDWNAQNRSKVVTAISLFSGGGGLDIGFHDAGFQILECNEIEPAFAATLQRNSGKGGRLEGTRVVCQDIHQYRPGVKHVDFIIGGPPCQTFSAAGARAAGVNGTDDDRGNLFLQYARILQELKPKGFLFENVYRIVGAQSGQAWKKILAAFRELGYKLHWRILDAADYGVPQFRERLIIVGLREGSYQFPFPSHGPDSEDQHAYYTARQAIRSLAMSDNSKGLNGRHGHLLNEIPPGLNYSYYTERMGHPKPIFAWRSKFSDYLYKADPDTPVRTIKAQGGQYTGPFSWENRPFTVEEFKRLQTFPDNYVVEGNRQKVIHQLGNSVPPQLARILALSILRQVFDARLPFELPSMPEKMQLGFRRRKAKLTEIYALKSADAISKIKATKKKKTPTPQNEVVYFSVAEDLSIQTKMRREESDFTVQYRQEKSEWTIRLSESATDRDEIQYEFKVQPPKAKQADSPSIIMSSTAGGENSVLALWKMYEIIIRRTLLKDDLIQMFGYYQYKQTYSIRLKVLDKALAKKPFWRLLTSVSSGVGVGTITAIADLCDLFDVNAEELLASLKQLKDIGYEVRNHSTNKQIPSGMVLIPYAFPTLNERSLQRLTRL